MMLKADKTTGAERMELVDLGTFLIPVLTTNNRQLTLALALTLTLTLTLTTSLLKDHLPMIEGGRCVS
jgi:hypothetical protein